jgi:TetR/AcrR family transcriptional regulator
MNPNQTVNKPVAPDAAGDDETRERLLQAAHRVFLRSGTAKARTQEIADEAGVNKALLHYYFGSKAALADAVFAQQAGTLLPRLFGILGAPDLSIEQKVRRVVDEQIGFHRANPFLAGFLATELHVEPDRIKRLIAPHGTPPLAPLDQQLRAAAAAGTMRPMPVEQFVLTLMGALMLPFVMRPMVELYFNLDGDRFDTFLTDRQALLPDFFMAGLRP